MTCASATRTTAAAASAPHSSRSTVAWEPPARLRPSWSDESASVVSTTPRTTHTTIPAASPPTMPPTPSASGTPTSTRPTTSSRARCVLSDSTPTRYPGLRRLSEVRLLGAEAAGLDGAARQAGARQRPRARAALGGRLVDGQRRSARRLLGTEDLFLGLAGQQRLEILLLDRLALDENL